jgi:hypothetical protein
MNITVVRIAATAPSYRLVAFQFVSDCGGCLVDASSIGVGGSQTSFVIVSLIESTLVRSSSITVRRVRSQQGGIQGALILVSLQQQSSVTSSQIAIDDVDIVSAAAGVVSSHLVLIVYNSVLSSANATVSNVSMNSASPSAIIVYVFGARITNATLLILDSYVSGPSTASVITVSSTVI